MLKPSDVAHILLQSHIVTEDIQNIEVDGTFIAMFQTIFNYSTLTFFRYGRDTAYVAG